ncbi:S8 family peptidase [Burkholderia sp. Ac-20379]|nr:S8 family peptidase [Burkholderia sp. Ac-20379]MBN3723565.1 S8 family peptidase [Burkholderia sp. Ac-20379]
MEPTPGGSSKKAYPYSILDARTRLRPKIEEIIKTAQTVPMNAKPRGEVASIITVHPAFQSKWNMPSKVFSKTGLRTVGSKPATVLPDNDPRVHAPVGEQPTVEIYASGTVDAFQAFLDMLLSDATGKGIQQDYRKLEAIRFLGQDERLLRITGDETSVPIELIIHANGSDTELLDDLESYAKECQSIIYPAKQLAVPGLVFMPGLVPRNMLDRFAQFTALRAIRRLPKLRLNRPVVRQRLTVQAPEVPDADALDQALHVAVFDGGLGAKDFSRWCIEHVPSDLADTHADYLSHGTEVTSALLFGAVSSGTPTLPRPFFNVVHHRVIGQEDEADPDLYDCMHRVKNLLDKGDIDFANLSLGPRYPIDDGHPHAWTVMLDNCLADGKTLMSVAVGNDGEISGPMSRIQAPADAVNALSVGSASSSEFFWSRAPYSSIGPGRSPGIVKPDGLAFGGTAAEPLVLLNPLSGGLTGVQGTSFASPLALRTAAAARAMSETQLSATALRALLIHRAERAEGANSLEVGWGRFPDAPEDLLTCGDSEASVLYHGSIAAGHTMRIQLPIPSVPIGVRFRIRATFCFTSPVDAADPVNYTKHGLTVTFRPRGPESTAPFFTSTGYGNEQDLRRGAFKWETVLHRDCSFAAEELLDAYFDVDHGAREHGLPVKNSETLSLPYVLIATIASERGEAIYQSVMQKYRALAPIQLRSQIRLTGQ